MMKSIYNKCCKKREKKAIVKKCTICYRVLTEKNVSVNSDQCFYATLNYLYFRNLKLGFE